MKFTPERILALGLGLGAIVLAVLEANGVLVLPVGIGEALMGLSGWLGLSKPSDAKALKTSD